MSSSLINVVVNLIITSFLITFATCHMTVFESAPWAKCSKPQLEPNEFCLGGKNNISTYPSQGCFTARDCEVYVYIRLNTSGIDGGKNTSTNLNVHYHVFYRFADDKDRDSIAKFFLTKKLKMFVGDDSTNNEDMDVPFSIPVLNCGRNSQSVTIKTRHNGTYSLPVADKTNFVKSGASFGFPENRAKWASCSWNSTITPQWTSPFNSSIKYAINLRLDKLSANLLLRRKNGSDSLLTNELRIRPLVKIIGHVSVDPTIDKNKIPGLGWFMLIIAIVLLIVIGLAIHSIFFTHKKAIPEAPRTTPGV